MRAGVANHGGLRSRKARECRCGSPRGDMLQNENEVRSRKGKMAVSRPRPMSTLPLSGVTRSIVPRLFEHSERRFGTDTAALLTNSPASFLLPGSPNILPCAVSLTCHRRFGRFISGRWRWLVGGRYAVTRTRRTSHGFRTRIAPDCCRVARDCSR